MNLHQFSRYRYISADVTVDDFILILFLIFLVESAAGFIQVFGSIASKGPLPYSISIFSPPD